MGLFRACGNGRPLRLQVGLMLFIAAAMFQSMPVSLGQNPVIFQYGYAGQDNLEVPGAPDAAISTIRNSSFTCLGDIKDLPTLYWNREYNASGNLSGRCLYSYPVQLIQPCPVDPPTAESFGTMFEAMITLDDPSQGIDSLHWLAFIITSDNSTQGDAGLAVKIDFQAGQAAKANIGVEKDGLSLNTTTLNTTRTLLSFPGGRILQLAVWIKFYASTHTLNVFVEGSPSNNYFHLSAVDKPQTPIMSTTVDLTDTFSGEKAGMFVGFSGFIPDTQSSTILIQPWTFNSNGEAPDVPRYANGKWIDPVVVGRKIKIQRILTITVSTIPSALVVLILMTIISLLYKRNARLIALAKKYEIEEGVLDRGPRNFKYRMLSTATKGFSSDQLLGSGGFGSVYKGRLLLKGDDKPTEVAVKRISATSHQGAQEFLAEVKIIGQVQHRNLVRLLGWCHEKGELLLVYNFMANGSVDQHIFSAGDPVLTWSRRLRIVSGVATALAYLHEEWEQRVIHRDVKSSNVMLDRDFNARLGDFGLARLSEHDQDIPSTAVLAGTYGYMAPELPRTLKPTEKTDVYSFGAVVLEVATGKKALLCKEDRESFDEVVLVDWVWGLYRDDTLLEAADRRLNNGYDPGEMVSFFKIGLLCSHPNPDERPNMREVINIWKGTSPFPPLPRSKPVPVFQLSRDDLQLDGQTDVSGTQTSEWMSDGGNPLTVPLNDDHDPLPVAQIPEGQLGASPNPTLRFRHTTTSLPF